MTRSARGLSPLHVVRRNFFGSDVGNDQRHPSLGQVTSKKETDMNTITPCLWFDGKAEEAANFYVSLFQDSRIDAIRRSPSDYTSGQAGDVITVEFTLMGRPFVGLNGGPIFKFNEAISLQIPVETQAEADRLTNALSAVPDSEVCGWVKDRYGLSWQILPRQLSELLYGDDTKRGKRAFDALMQMKRIDIAALARAAG
jgi:predicted 3-demethylubiquinone-9 3-methyltransferase (glyoxalase superfamily)